MAPVTATPDSVIQADLPDGDPDALQAVSANRMPWLFAIFIVGIALLVGLKVLFADLYVELEQRGGNERSRLFIGDEIVREIGGVETAVYRLALADNPSALKRARQDIEAQLGKLEGDILVLQHGGTVRREIQLNIEGRDEMIREFPYSRQLDDSSFVMEVIEVAPLLDTIRSRADGLEELLMRRSKYREEGRRDQLFLVDAEISVFTKNVAALFFRIKENANRLYFDSSERLLRIESALATQREHLRVTEWFLVGLVVLLATVAGWFFVRQTREANDKLRKTWNAMRVARDEAERASRAKSDFVSRMSHELRTPLNAILGFAQLLERDPLPASHQNYVRLINRSGQHLLELINQVLDLAKIEAGRLTLESIVFDFRDTIAEVGGIVAQRAAEKGLSFLPKVAGDLPSHVIGDPTRLRQVLINLTANAVKFTEAGSVELMIAMQDQRLLFSIRDTGIGMDEAAVNRLFLPFSQGDESITRRYGGTGLGLIIARELIQAMGGEIAVDSKPGIGSCFRFSLPLRPANAPKEAPQGSAEKAAGTSDKPRALAELVGGPVLLVDDNVVNQLVGGAMLEQLGLTYETAADGLEALDRLAEKPYGMVLMDMEMPEMDGLTATHRIRAREAGSGQRTAVIAMTANVLQGDRERCLQAGMDGYVAKPINVAVLDEELRRVLAKDTCAV
ncbi:MAG: ATP-binding protein [Candidatus Accumulibacter phosphatis]|nr:ATP-binding protein [Candidatus Accumulibacter phosphatis]